MAESGTKAGLCGNEVAANDRWPNVDWSNFPGAEHVRLGLAQINDQQPAEQAYTVLLAKTRLAQLGFSISCNEAADMDATDALYQLLVAQHGDEAHARFNAIRREIVSFAEAFDGAIARENAMVR